MARGSKLTAATAASAGKKKRGGEASRASAQARSAQRKLAEERSDEAEERSDDASSVKGERAAQARQGAKRRNGGAERQCVKRQGRVTPEYYTLYTHLFLREFSKPSCD